MESYLNSAFFSRLETLSLRLQPDLRGFFGGKHKVKSYGQTIDFADYREYVPGDDIRRIDWNLYSRFKKLYLKLFTDERQMQVQIFLDCSASMGLNPEKAKYAISAMASLGYLAVRSTDKISMYFIKDNTVHNPYGKIIGRNAFFGMVSELESVKFEGESDFYSAITHCEGTGYNDGLTIIISDFMTDSDYKGAVKFLCEKRRQVLLLQILTPEEISPAYMGKNHLIDVETTEIDDKRNMRLRITRSMLSEYDEVMKEIFKDLRNFAISQNIDYVSVRTDVPIEKMLFGELLKTGLIS